MAASEFASRLKTDECHTALSEQSNLFGSRTVKLLYRVPKRNVQYVAAFCPGLYVSGRRAETYVLSEIEYHGMITEAVVALARTFGGWWASWGG